MGLSVSVYTIPFVVSNTSVTLLLCLPYARPSLLGRAYTELASAKHTNIKEERNLFDFMCKHKNHQPNYINWTIFSHNHHPSIHFLCILVPFVPRSYFLSEVYIQSCAMNAIQILHR